MSAALQVQGLSVATAQAPAIMLVRDVCFAIGPGESLSLLGESGSGKSLLAQAIMGNLPPGLVAGGTVQLGDEATPADDPQRRRPWWGRRLALLPQEPWSALDPTMPALAQVGETHRYVRGASAAQARQAALADLDRLGLAGAAHHYPFMLSGGMAQRVAFAATVAGGAPVLIVDEPTKGLDASLCGQVVALLRAVLERGGSVLAITHDVAVARALGGQVAVMLDSRIVEQGSAAELLNRPAHEYTRRLLAAEPAAWPRQPTAAYGGRQLLQATGLAKAYGGRRLFDGIDVTLNAGERLAITGDSGSGKTTLGNLLLGLVRPDRGQVVRGAGIETLGFQKLYQDPLAAFAPRLGLRHALADLAKLHGLAWPGVTTLMARLRLPEALLDRRPDQVSGGELQRLALLRVLLLAPALVFADEPTSRLDPILQRDTFQLLTESLAERGSALLLVTHDAQIAAKVADRVIAIG